jgi:hypothetical protein
MAQPTSSNVLCIFELANLGCPLPPYLNEDRSMKEPYIKVSMFECIAVIFSSSEVYISFIIMFETLKQVISAI